MGADRSKQVLGVEYPDITFADIFQLSVGGGDSQCYFNFAIS